MKQSYTDLSALLLRLGFGGMMIPHGIKKLERLEDGVSNASFSDPIGLGGPATLIIAVVVEIIFSLFVILGIKVRLSTVPLILTMLIAAFVVHANDPFVKKEMALLYLTGYLAIWCLGAGKYSFRRLR